jgi:hypothetical protein
LAEFLHTNRPANFPAHLRALDFLGWGWNLSMMNEDDETSSRPVSSASHALRESQHSSDDNFDTNSLESLSTSSPSPPPNTVLEPALGAGLLSPHRARGIYSLYIVLLHPCHVLFLHCFVSIVLVIQLEVHRKGRFLNPPSCRHAHIPG